MQSVYSLKKRYIVKLLSSMVSGVTGIITVAIVPNVLGAIPYGQFSFIYQIFSQFIAFFDAGTSTAFFTKLSAKTHRKELIKAYTAFSLMMLILLYLVVEGLYILNLNEVIFPDIQIKYLYLGVNLGFFLWLTQIYIKISDAYMLTISVEIIKIIHKFLSLLLLIFMISFINFDLTTYFYFNYISLISFLLVITIVFIKKEIITRNVWLAKIKYQALVFEFFNYASPLFVFNSVAILVAIFDIWLLQYVSGSEQTGFYGIAYSIIAMCFLFTGAMTQIITREYSKSFAENDHENIKKLFIKYTPMLYALAAYFGIFLSFQSETLIDLFMDNEFKDVYFVLTIMAFYPLHQTYGQLNSSLFFSIENTRQYRDISFVSTFFSLILSFIFVYELEMGAVGFAWKMVLAQLIGVNIQLFVITHFLKIKLKYLIIHQVIVLLFFTVIAYFVSSLPWLNDKGLVGFLVAGFLYTLIGLGGVFLFPSIFGFTRAELNNFVYKTKS